MNNILKNLLTLAFFGASLLSLIACKQDSSKTLTTETLEVFEVTGTDSSLKPSVLKYKDVKYYRGALLVAQDFYHVDNTMKGFEIIKKDGNKGISNYFSMDSTLLAIYHLEYSGDHIKKRTGYDGQTKEMLRYETYKRDSKGNLMVKEIYDSSGRKVRSFKMALDQQGNEAEVLHLDAEDTTLQQEIFEIIKKDDKNRWLEKWGQVNGVTSSFHRRTFKDISSANTNK